MEMTPTFDVWGIVVAAADTTEKGSLRIKIPAMQEGMDIFESVPVLTAYGGSEYGIYWLPEVGDMVRVTFLNGDFGHPVVTGCRLTSDSRLVQEAWKKENSDKVLQVKNGSKIVFFGEKGKEKIEISGPDKLKWVLDEEKVQFFFGDKEQKNRMLLDGENGTALLETEKEMELRCGKSSLILKCDGSLTIRCNKMVLEAKETEIRGNSKMKLSGQELVLEGTTGLQLSGRSKMNIESKGPVHISGAAISLN